MTQNTDSQLTQIQKTMQAMFLLMTVLTVAVGFLFYQQYTTPKAAVAGVAEVAQPAPTYLSKYPTLKKTDHVRGNRNSKYLLVEYSDYECPFCKSFHQTVNTFLESHKDVAFVYRHFPLDSIHQQARPEAIAAECVAKLGGEEAFWKFTDLVFEVTLSNDGLDLTLLPEYVEQSGVSTADFDTCYKAKETEAIVEADLKSGAEFGVNGTPGSFLINIKTKKAVQIPGALPLAQLEAAFAKVK